MTNLDTHAHHRHQRYAIPKPVCIMTGDQTHKGAILDISASGAAIQLDAQLEDGTRIDLLMEGVGQIAAQVARSLANGVAVKFDLDPGKEADFLDALGRAINAALPEAGPTTSVS